MEITFDKLYLWLGFLMNVFSEENPYNLSDSEREKLMALLEESEQTQRKSFEKELKKLRDICRSYDSCYDGCSLNVDKGNCVMVKPPYIWSDKDIEKFTQFIMKGE